MIFKMYCHDNFGIMHEGASKSLTPHGHMKFYDTIMVTYCNSETDITSNTDVGI